MYPVVIPAEYMLRIDAPRLADYGRCMLAEGDSWFTIGTINLPRSSNLLFKLQVTTHTLVINCAYPGDTLRHMVAGLHDPLFRMLLFKMGFAERWDGILISAGGNDMIDALQLGPLGSGGEAVPQNQRLLLAPAEVDAGRPVAGRYVSEPGWRAFAADLMENMRSLVQMRDAGPSRGRPIFMHTYAVPTVRPAGSPGSPKGWLFPAFEAYGVPPAHRDAVTAELFGRLRTLLMGLNTHTREHPHVFVFDSASLADIVPAVPGAVGESNDWINEIHLTPGGYAKVSRHMGEWMEGLLRAY